MDIETDKLIIYFLVRSTIFQFSLLRCKVISANVLLSDFTALGDCSVTGKIPEIVRPMLKVENNADNYE